MANIGDRVIVDGATHVVIRVEPFSGQTTTIAEAEFLDRSTISADNPHETIHEVKERERQRRGDNS